MGRVLKVVNISSYMRIRAQVEARKQREEKERQHLESAPSFKFVLWSKKYDDWFLDPIVGFVFPGYGDVVSAVASLASIYFAAFRLRSFKLAFAIYFITVVDVLCGLIPFVGDFVDALYKSNKRAARWIVGFMEKDPETLSEINRHALWGGIILAILIIVFVALFSTIVAFFTWLFHLVNNYLF